MSTSTAPLSPIELALVKALTSAIVKELKTKTTEEAPRSKSAA